MSTEATNNSTPSARDSAWASIDVATIGTPALAGIHELLRQTRGKTSGAMNTRICPKERQQIVDRSVNDHLVAAVAQQRLQADDADDAQPATGTR